MDIIAAVAGGLTHEFERISLERRVGKWGLYFTRQHPLVGTERKVAETVPIKDAPLDVRERFFVKSEEFFRTYLDTSAKLVLKKCMTA